MLKRLADCLASNLFRQKKQKFVKIFLQKKRRKLKKCGDVTFAPANACLWPQDTKNNNIQRNDTQNNGIHHNDIQQYYDTQRSDIKNNDIQHNNIQLNAIQHSDTRHKNTQHNDT